MTLSPASSADRAGLVPELAADELAALQLRRLRRTLRHAYDHVPFYRTSFDAAGVTPEDCRTLADLARFPFTTKADLRANYPLGLCAVPEERISRIHASSGTTGQPTIVPYTDGDVDRWSDLVARCLRAAGVRPGDRVHIAYGYGLFTGGLGAHYGAERLGCTVVPASVAMTGRQVGLIRDLRPTVIMATPSYLLTLLDECERQGIDPRSTSLRVGLLGAEPWTESMRAEIEERAGIDAVDIYGLSEALGPGVAGESVRTKDGVHLWEDHFLPEVVDPASLAVQHDGSPGELVLTSLTKEAMPVIRYRTRDLTRLLPGTAFGTFRRLERVHGRSDDMLVVRGVNLFPSQVEEAVLRTDGLAPHFRVELTREGRLDRVTVRAEAHSAATGERERTEAGRALVRALREITGLGMAVEVCEPGSLERSKGKLDRVRDRRGTDAAGTDTAGANTAGSPWRIR
ncbi:phenylacetate--CoA ligase family protein [Streptomyces sp. NPDC003943]